MSIVCGALPLLVCGLGSLVKEEVNALATNNGPWLQHWLCAVVAMVGIVGANSAIRSVMAAMSRLAMVNDEAFERVRFPQKIFLQSELQGGVVLHPSTPEGATRPTPHVNC